MQFRLHAGMPRLIRHLEEIDLWRGAAIFSSASIRPKRLSVVLTTILAASTWLKSTAKGSGSARSPLDRSGNLFKRLRISRSQHDGGEVAGQSDSSGASDALAGSSHNCDRILHDFLSLVFDSFCNFDAALRKRRLRSFEDDVYNLVWRGEQRSVINRERPYCRIHTFCHEALRFRIDHSVLFRNQVPRGL